MQTLTKKLDELKRPEKNVRVHSDRQIKEYIRSIEMFGQIRPLVIDENNVVLAGNGLLTALKEMGRETADCYVVSGLTAKEKKKLMLVDNKIFELGVNDMGAFDDILRELGGDIDIPGYDVDLLKTLTASFDEANKIISPAMSGEKFAEMKTPQAKMQMPPETTQKINPSTEISTENFADDKFNCQCPRCGFKFNV
ncbi:MAG: ParB N-terminal domain-containing protein [Selenomonadaceae bacterium]|nr:ParB N-terminal domain-containing protein [Selenomonadaceae bacterium]